MLLCFLSVSSRFLHRLSGRAGASVIRCRAVRCRRLDVNHTGSLGNGWARLTAKPDWSADGEPEVTSPHRSTDGYQLWWDHVESQTNSSGLQYLWTLFISSHSRSDFRAYCFILQLLSNRLAWVCVAEQERRCEGEKGVQVLNLLFLSVCQKCGWMLNISTPSSSNGLSKEFSCCTLTLVCAERCQAARKPKFGIRKYIKSCGLSILVQHLQIFSGHKKHQI